MYPLLTKTATVESQNYKLEYILGWDFEHFNPHFINSPLLPFFTKTDYDMAAGASIIRAFSYISDEEVASGYKEIEIYPQQNYAFTQLDDPSKDLKMAKYDKQRFEWPSSCPYIRLPICDWFKWYWEGYFELAHKWETIKFRLPTEYSLRKWYNPQVFIITLDSDNVYLKVSASSNAVVRDFGYYKVATK